MNKDFYEDVYLVKVALSNKVCDNCGMEAFTVDSPHCMHCGHEAEDPAKQDFVDTFKMSFHTINEEGIKVGQRGVLSITKKEEE
jgi:ribosomal protein S27AE